MLARRTSVPASATATVHALVQQLKKDGHTVYDLSVGEPAFPTPSFLIEAAEVALRKEEQFYPPVAGFAALREAVSSWMNRCYGATFAPEQVLVTGGGKFGVYLSLEALVDPGDEVVIVAPHWVSYPSMVELFEGKVQLVHAQESRAWKISPEDLKGVCSERTKVLVLNNGCNPTGAIYNRAELEALLAVLPQDTWILSDEVYSGLVYGQDYVSLSSLPTYAHRTVVVQSCSKNFAMTGWRIGFVLGPRPLIEVLIKLQGQSITAPAALSQHVALAALQHAESLQKEVNLVFERRRDLFIQGLNAVFGPTVAPCSALYVFLPLSYFGENGEDDVAFAEKLLKTVQVAVVPGSAFGRKAHVRLAFGGTEDQLQACLDRLSLYKSQFSL